MDRECGRLQQCSWSTFSSWRQLAQKQQLRRASGKVLLRANSAVAIWVNLLDARHMVSQAMPVCAYMQDVTDERRDLDESNCQSRRWLNLLSFSTRAIVGRSSNAYEAIRNTLYHVGNGHMEAEQIRRDGNIFDACLTGFNATELRLELGSRLSTSSATHQRSSSTKLVGR